MNIIGTHFIRNIAVEGTSIPSELKIAVSQGQANDYAAYIGCGSNEFIANLGSKLTEEEFMQYVPKLYHKFAEQGLVYRR